MAAVGVRHKRHQLMRRGLLLASLLLAGCDNGSPPAQDTPVNPLSEIKARLAFNCAHEQIPAPSAETDELFQYARWLQKNNLLKQDKSVDAEIERLYRIAAENGHYKANINLQNGTMRGHFMLSGADHLRLSQQLINANVATGYYFIGIFLKHGSAGLKQDASMSLRYLRKAADEGSAQALYELGDLLAPIDIAPDIARQMRRCAAEQGHGKAAMVLGIDLSTDGHYREALEAFQLGVVAGDDSSAGWLEAGFRTPSPSDRFHYLAQQEDPERAERYEKIWRILANYSYADPKVPEINEILPLPPAKLPAWDGKLQWLEARLANVPPKKPGEALIQQLAKAMLLEPATGRATAVSSVVFKARYPHRPAPLSPRTSRACGSSDKPCAEDYDRCATGRSLRQLLRKATTHRQASHRKFIIGLQCIRSIGVYIS